MKRKRSNHESRDNNVLSGLLLVLSVALYFISEGFAKLKKPVMQSGGKYAQKAKSKPARVAPKPHEKQPRFAQKTEKQVKSAAVAAATGKKAAKQTQAVPAAAAKAPATRPQPVAAPAKQTEKPAAAATKAPEKPAQPVAATAAVTAKAENIAAIFADKKSEKQAKKKPVKKLYIILLFLLSVAACVLLAIGAVRLFASVRANNIYKDLSSGVQEAKNPTVPLTGEPAGDPAAPTVPVAEEPIAETVPAETEPQMLPQYAQLYAKNPDLFGWVKIDDTKIDYPVMYAPDDLEKYLYRDFEGNSYSGGTPYMDVRCTVDSENYLIYGHNMKNGTMFKHLLKYESESFRKEHPTVYFDTLYEEGEYEVVAAFYDRVYYTYEDCFKFYDVIELEEEAGYNDAISKLKEKSLYDTGVVPAYGTQLVTLITCAYHVDNGKFVVVLAEKAA